MGFPPFFLGAKIPIPGQPLQGVPCYSHAPFDPFDRVRDYVKLIVSEKPVVAYCVECTFNHPDYCLFAAAMTPSVWRNPFANWR